ncbi:hypothetical protein KCU90_g199, partial [Aureobasidium melanogenum]
MKKGNSKTLTIIRNKKHNANEQNNPGYLNLLVASHNILLLAPSSSVSASCSLLLLPPKLNQPPDFFALVSAERSTVILFVAEVFMLLQKSAVFGVGFEVGIGNIANERHDTDKEVNSDVDEHLNQNAHWQATLNLHATLHEQKSNTSIDSITGSGNYSNHGGPSKACTEEFEERHVHSVSATAHFGELAWVVDVDEEWVLQVIVTSSPQGFLLWYFFICPRNILLAAYFPTAAAMFVVFLDVWSTIK